MLVLTRKVGDEITIGDNGEIKIVVVAINGKQVRIGVEADRATAIHRGEIFKRIKSQESGELVEAKASSIDDKTNSHASDETALDQPEKKKTVIIRKKIPKVYTAEIN